MSKSLTSVDIQKIKSLNTQLTSAEEKIYNLSKVQNQVALRKLLESEMHISDYKLEVNISLYTNQSELVFWSEDIKPHFLNDIPCNINDKKNHNVSSTIINNSELNSQQHCWLMHRLYDDFSVDWVDILLINHILFDVNIHYQYSIDLDLLQ
jgi:hypothetical protein